MHQRKRRRKRDDIVSQTTKVNKKSTDTACVRVQSRQTKPQRSLFTILHREGNSVFEQHNRALQRLAKLRPPSEVDVLILMDQLVQTQERFFGVLTTSRKMVDRFGKFGWILDMMPPDTPSTQQLAATS